MHSDEFYKTIANDLGLDKETVKDVWQRGIDVTVEEMFKTGKTSIRGFCSVKPKKHTGYNIQTRQIEETAGLSIKLSDHLYRAWKYITRTNLYVVNVNRDNWREVVRFFRQNKKDDTSLPSLINFVSENDTMLRRMNSVIDPDDEFEEFFRKNSPRL